MAKSDNRKVFISYSHEDEDVVEGLAKDLLSHGQDVWLDRWEIAAGDSIISKIFEEGLSKAAGILVVLSNASIQSKWVREELNLATVRRIEDLTRVIPVLVDAVEVPAALRTLRWVDLRKDYEAAVRSIVNALQGIQEKPPISDVPSYIAQLPDAVGELSQTASQVGLLILDANKPEDVYRKVIRADEISTATGLTPTEVNDAVDELGEHGLIKTHREVGTHPYEFAALEALYTLFLHFAEYVDYDPIDDIKMVAASVASLERADGTALQETTGLSPARINRAVEYIAEYGVAEVRRFLGTRPFTFGDISATRRTRQFASG